MKQFFGDRQTLAKEDICDMDKDFVERFKSLIEVKMGDSELNVEDLGKEMGLSRVQLYRKIKSLTTTLLMSCSAWHVLKRRHLCWLLRI